MLNNIKKALRFAKKGISCKYFKMTVMASLAVVSMSWLVASAKTVTVSDGEFSHSVTTFSSDTTGIIEQAGIELGEHDTVITDENGNISVTRKFKVNIVVGTTTVSALTEGGSVGEVLLEQGIEVSKEDTLNYPVDSEVFDGMTIELISVDYVYVSEYVSIPYSTETVYSAYLTKGTTKTVGGVKGEKKVTYKKKLVNGIEQESVKVDEKVTVLPTSKITYIGTNNGDSTETVADESKWISTLRPEESIKLDENGAPVEYKKLIQGIASAYSPVDGLASATGVVLRPGYIAVNPKTIPYGTKMYIVTQDGTVIYGYAVAADTGGFVTKYPDRIVDLFFPSDDAAWNFGLKYVNIYILE